MQNVDLYLGDNLEVMRAYKGPPIQLILWSSPYPGLRGFDVTPEDYLSKWLPERVLTAAAKLKVVSGVYIQVIKFKRLPGGWFDRRQFQIADILEDYGGLKLIDVVPWDKKNAPPSGAMKRIDHDAYELIFIAAKSEAYTYHKYYDSYAEKTKKKAAAASRPEYQIDIFGKSHTMAQPYRQADVTGQLSGGHYELSKDGAIQPNIWRFSPSGDETGRPRVKGGSFPLKLARRGILQYSDPGDLVMDLCGGAGTTVIEAMRHGRHAAAIEILPDRFGIMANWVTTEAAKLGPSAFNINLHTKEGKNE